MVGIGGDKFRFGHLNTHANISKALWVSGPCGSLDPFPTHSTPAFQGSSSSRHLFVGQDAAHSSSVESPFVVVGRVAAVRRRRSSRHSSLVVYSLRNSVFDVVVLLVIVRSFMFFFVADSFFLRLLRRRFVCFSERRARGAGIFVAKFFPKIPEPRTDRAPARNRGARRCS